MTSYCCVCRNRVYNCEYGVVFHHFPTDPVLRESWLKILKLDAAKNRLVCSQHFTKNDYRALCDRKLLKKGAIPSINIPGSEEDVDSQSNAQKFEQCLIKTEPMEPETENEPVDNTGASNNIESVPRQDTISPIFNYNTKRTDFEQCMIKIEPPNETEDIDPDNGTIQTVQKQHTVSTISASAQSLKRANNSRDESTTKSPRIRCFLREFGLFRRADFTSDDAWSRFVVAWDNLRSENNLLRRKNNQLLNEIQTLQNAVDDLEPKDTSSDSD